MIPLILIFSILGFTKYENIGYKLLSSQHIQTCIACCRPMINLNYQSYQITLSTFQFQQTLIALATATKSVLGFMGHYFKPFWKGFMILVAIMTAIFFPYVACFYYSDYQPPGEYFCILSLNLLLCKSDNFPNIFVSVS